MTPRVFAIFGTLWFLLGSTGASRPVNPRELGAGAQLPSLVKAGKLLNAPADAPQPRQGWVIYAFAPGTAASVANSTRVEQLAGALPLEDWAFLAMATAAEGLVPFVDRQHVTVPVLAQVSREILTKYPTSKVPRTFVLDKDWRLIETLDGTYQRAVAKKLEQRFKVRWKPAPARVASGKSDPETRQGDRRYCLNREQKEYSHGADVELLGAKFRCGSGGFWFPVG